MAMRESEKLRHTINAAIEDGKLTSQEYNQILAQAASDGREDPEEIALLRNLHEMIANGVIRRVA